MNDLTLFPADIAELSVGQLAALPPEQKLEVDQNLDAALDWLKQARAKFDQALEQCYGEQARAALRESGRDFGTVHLNDGPVHVKFEQPKRVSWDEKALWPKSPRASRPPGSGSRTTSTSSSRCPSRATPTGRPRCSSSSPRRAPSSPASPRSGCRWPRRTEAMTTRAMKQHP